MVWLMFGLGGFNLVLAAMFAVIAVQEDHDMSTIALILSGLSSLSGAALVAGAGGCA